MDVFVTGGTGLIGSAVVAELVANGHHVVGLARSDASAAELDAAGAGVARGAFSDLDVLRGAAAAADGVIHLAFSNDFSSPESVARSVSEESDALTAIGEVMAGGGRPLVTVSGTPVVAGRLSTEDDPLPAAGAIGGRNRSIAAVLALANRGVRATSVRLPRTVHSRGEGGFTGILIRAARSSGVAGYPGDGRQRWPAVHVLDAAKLFRVALETAPAGTSWHAVADEGVRVRDMAEVIGRRLGLPVAEVPGETFGPLGHIFVLDQPSSSVRTRAELGWRPIHPSLLDDLENLRRGIV